MPWLNLYISVIITMFRYIIIIIYEVSTTPTLPAAVQSRAKVVYFETNFAKVSEPEGCLELLDVHCCTFEEWA